MAEPTWDDFPVVGQAPATMPNPQVPMRPGPPAFIPGTPKPQAQPSMTEQWRTMAPEEITQAGLAPDKVYQVNAAGQIRAAGDAAGGNGDPKAYAAARQKLMQAIGFMNQTALDASDNRTFPGLGETGTSGQFMRWIPGANAGKSLAADVTTLEANFAFDALQAMRDASKTGGALGNVSERELDLLKASVANIDPDLEHDTFMRNMQAARDAYLSKLALVDMETAQRMGYDPKRAEQAWLTLNDHYNERFGMTEQAPSFESVPGGEWKVERID